MNDHLVIAPPKADEYHQSLAVYISLVGTDDLLSYFESQKESVASLAQTLSEEQLLFRYAPNKWSVKDIFCHIIDCERIYGYRALCIARGDKTELPGFEENDYAESANADRRDIVGIVREYKSVRSATIELFKSFDEATLLSRGTANGSIRSVRSIGYVAAGHELHHLNVIKERYLRG
ncbi:MAG: DinB family protein [Ignavibacteriota bacterium]